MTQIVYTVDQDKQVTLVMEGNGVDLFVGALDIVENLSKQMHLDPAVLCSAMAQTIKDEQEKKNDD